MRVAVVGCGAIGGLLAAFLARGGQDVTVVVDEPQRTALRADGLRVTSPLVGAFSAPVAATDAPAEIGPVDLVLFTTKTYQLEAVAQRITPLIGPRTMVLPLQPGVESALRLSRFIPPQQILGGVCSAQARWTAPGAIEHRGDLRLIVGELAGGTSARLERLHRLLQDVGLACERSRAIRVALWQRMLFDCAFDGVAALTRLPLGTVLDCAETRALCRGIMEEVARLAAARVAPLPDEAFEQAFRAADALAPAIRGSLAEDFEAGRPLELEALHGAAVRFGQEHGIQTPFNFAVYAALKPYVHGRTC